MLSKKLIGCVAGLAALYLTMLAGTLTSLPAVKCRLNPLDTRCGVFFRMRTFTIIPREWPCLMRA